MEICKAPTLRLKVLNKHTHNVHRDGKCYQKKIIILYWQVLTYINSNEVEQIFLLWQTGVILGGKCVTKFDTKSEEEKKVAQKKKEETQIQRI